MDSQATILYKDLISGLAHHVFIPSWLADVERTGGCVEQRLIHGRLKVPNSM